MIEDNIKFLKAKKLELLETYRDKIEPASTSSYIFNQVQGFECEEGNANRPFYEIAPKFYKKQQDATSGKKGPDLAIVSGTNNGLAVEPHVEFKHLIVIEPELPSYLASLDVVNWPELKDEYERSNRSIYIHVGKMDIKAKESLKLHLEHIGLYNAHKVSMSYDSEKKSSIKAMKEVLNCLQETVGNFGFFDDEKDGMSHTIENMSHDPRVLMGVSQPWIKKTAIVCGNGPSLTNSMEMIKSIREKVFVISCGTTLGALFRNGIKPDLHVEKERPKVIRNWIARSTTSEYRKGIAMIGLNVIHPEIRELFDEVMYCMKSNDLGATLMDTGGLRLPKVMFSGPLASNFGLSVAVAIGFKSIYMAGVDCAFTDDGQRHADGHPVKYEANGKIELPGNFREKVWSDDMYNRSRKNLELVIHYSKGIEFFNLSDGAKIMGADPAESVNACDELEAFDPYDNFREIGLSIDRGKVRKHCVEGIDQFSKFCFFTKDLDEIYKELKRLKQTNPVCWGLIKGSVNTQLTFLARATKEEFPKSFLIFLDFLMAMRIKIGQQLFKFCEWESNGGLPDDVNA